MVKRLQDTSNWATALGNYPTVLRAVKEIFQIPCDRVNSKHLNMLALMPAKGRLEAPAA